MTNKLKRANLDFLLAVWFPYASEQALKDLTYFCGWMFLVDDEIDGVSGPGFDNEKAFAALYRGTLGFVERSLDLGGQVSEEDLRCANATAESFGRIGEALCEQYSVGQREMFLEEAKLTLDGYRFEQQLRLRGQLPSFAEYWAYREGSCCCRQTVAMLEYVFFSIAQQVWLIGAQVRKRPSYSPRSHANRRHEKSVERGRSDPLDNQ